MSASVMLIYLLQIVVRLVLQRRQYCWCFWYLNHFCLDFSRQSCVLRSCLPSHQTTLYAYLRLLTSHFTLCSYWYTSAFRKTRFFKKKPNPGGFYWVLLGFNEFFFGRAVLNDVKYTWKGKMTNRRLIVNFWKRTMINYLHILGVFYTLNYASVPEVNC